MLESNLACKVLDPSGLENSLSAPASFQPRKPPVGGERVYDVKSDITSFGLKPLRISLWRHRFRADGCGRHFPGAPSRGEEKPGAGWCQNKIRKGWPNGRAEINGYGNTEVICLSDEGDL